MTTKFKKGVDNGYLDFRVQDSDGVYIYPDWNTNCYVELYDYNNTLQDTFTISSSPAIQKGVDDIGNYLYISGIDISNYAVGTTLAYVYAYYNGSQISSYPTVMVPFEVVSGSSAVTPGAYYVGTSFSLYHRLYDNYGELKLGLTHDEVQSWYVQGNGALYVKSLNTDNFIEHTNGVYEIKFDSNEVSSAGIFVNIVKSVYYDYLSMEIVGVINPTGTCSVTGNFLDLNGAPKVRLPITIVNRDYSRMLSNGSLMMGEKKVAFSGIDGSINFALVPGSLVEINYNKSSYVVEVPDQGIISFNDLVSLATDNYQPVDIT